MGTQKASGGAEICSGTIDAGQINAAHAKIKEIVKSYKQVNLKVSTITSTVNENWVGKGNTEFRSQYKNLIQKVEDFGDLLDDIYDALVEAEASYEDTDDNIRQEFVMSDGQS